MPEECADVVRARDVLERLIAMPDVDFTAWFLLGQARRLLRDHSGAYAAFACAYGLAPDQIETGRNLAQECIALGYAQEAITVSAATAKLAPDNARLIANHACALFVGGDLDGAYREVQRAEHLDPDDEITLHLRTRIEDVRAGRVEAPARVDA
jgi:tetratricopeptide (TPR) repeat protein